MSKSIFNGAGYFMNDDRASGGKLDEDDIVGCWHCHKPIKKAAWKAWGGVCIPCGAKPLCGPCKDRAMRFGCEGPQLKKIEQAVNDDYRRQQNAKVIGI